MSRSGYQPLAQSAEEEEDVDVTEEIPQPSPRRLRRPRPGHIDLTKLDTAFKRWTESIAHKVKKRKKKTAEHSKREIWRSVFEPTVAGISVTEDPLKTLDHNPPMTTEAFDAVVQSIKSAITEGIHPKMITKGSSGSYFARAKDDGRVRTVAVFKPKDEEPYGRLNPKTTKWIHRQFRWIIPFGRPCLIPNLSYISEAAASLLDSRLQLRIVPPTQLASISSPAFFYDWIDRKTLPEKIGSMQYFLNGYLDASEFLRKHPWPGRAIADTFDDSTHRQGGLTKRLMAMSGLNLLCGRTGDIEDSYDDYEEERLFDATESTNGPRDFYWSPALQRSFREELEKGYYLMLNTDRGADNYMIKYCEGEVEKQLIDVAPSKSTREMPIMSELRRGDNSNQSANVKFIPSSPETPGDYTRRPHIHIAAIDNSLSFPHEHPQGWRSYTYGWLYLPVSVIGKPFSEKTRNHFLPLLTSKAWWEETTFQLEKLFAVDPDFNLKMFRRQLAVIKGQALNIVQSLKHADEGPLELTRRTKMLVWDDEIEVSEASNGLDEDQRNEPLASPKLSISSVPILPRRPRSTSASSDFPPPIRRMTTDTSGLPRPVPFSAKFQRVHPGTTGVTVLEHLERLDAVEASLQRLEITSDDDEVDVGESSSQARKKQSSHSRNVSSSSDPSFPSPFSPPGSPPLPTVPEMASLESSITEEDLVALSKSTSHMEDPPTNSSRGHHRWASQALGSGSGVDWLQDHEAPVTRVVISERLEMVTKTPLCSCW
ncbi:phosphatidylinositol 3 and 4-kinase-domain-containing protein [Rhodocollybia butyracea]|uniref:Phosphatidylinositol 4-kinase n=1 Tax=Rhodocollybia butyracea TaxID=206335 RepID=A0A9P5U961_9AGAR|nr:phosphatidylinositol 3 and 4-kinase-domain-containing protein [Rhodocollybia butyracea]